MTEWKDVLPNVVSALSTSANGHACILEFLKILPEEVTEGRKINLTVCEPNDNILLMSVKQLCGLKH